MSEILTILEFCLVQSNMFPESQVKNANRSKGETTWNPASLTVPCLPSWSGWAKVTVGDVFIATCKAANKTLRKMSFHIHLSILFSLLLLSLRQGLHVPWRYPMTGNLHIEKLYLGFSFPPSMSSCKMPSLLHNRNSHFHSEVDLKLGECHLITIWLKHSCEVWMSDRLNFLSGG